MIIRIYISLTGLEIRIYISNRFREFVVMSLSFIEI